MIDINTLHIGSHVLYDGKRERVRGLDEDNGLIIRFPAEYVLASEVEPIPITEELLTELGFEEVTLHTRPNPITQFVDADSVKAQAVDLDARVVPRIAIQYINVTNPFWSVSAYGENMEDNKAAVRYLHELEQFLYLTTKTELIKPFIKVKPECLKSESETLGAVCFGDLLDEAAQNALKFADSYVSIYQILKSKQDKQNV